VAVDIKDLPDDVETLKLQLINYIEENKILRQRVKFLKAIAYGRKSEKRSKEDLKQVCLFDEIEKHSTENISLEDKQIKVSAHNRKKGGRRLIPDFFERENIIHDLPDGEKICSCGNEMTKIGEDISEKMEFIPATVRVQRHIKYKYACKKCEGVDDKGLESPGVKTAKLPDHLLPKSIATPSLLAYIFIAKFCDAIPFYRLGKIFNRFKVDISQATLCNWAIKIYHSLNRFLNLLYKELLNGKIIFIDETSLQVLKEPGKKDTTKSYMWVFKGGNHDRPIILFNYRPNRQAEFISEILEGYKGAILTDGYKGYNKLFEKMGLVHAGCWAHVRRNFYNITKIVKDSKSANIALDYIEKLYKNEKKVKYKFLSPDKALEYRRELSQPVINEFKNWLDKTKPLTDPDGYLGQAVNYTLNEWPKLIKFLDDLNIPLDNNDIERAIRPFTVGRKNWLFSGSPRGASASAALYSLIETAKACRLEPYWYLYYLFFKLPKMKTDEDLKTLFPQNLEHHQIYKQTRLGNLL
jgi:transposase